jgi:hypothetical protein
MGVRREIKGETGKRKTETGKSGTLQVDFTFIFSFPILCSANESKEKERERRSRKRKPALRELGVAQRGFGEGKSFPTWKNLD